MLFKAFDPKLDGLLQCFYFVMNKIEFLFKCLFFKSYNKKNRKRGKFKETFHIIHKKINEESHLI